jgi:hypothetical protein
MHTEESADSKESLIMSWLVQNAACSHSLQKQTACEKNNLESNFIYVT